MREGNATFGTCRDSLQKASALKGERTFLLHVQMAIQEIHKARPITTSFFCRFRSWRAHLWETSNNRDFERKRGKTRALSQLVGAPTPLGTTRRRFITFSRQRSPRPRGLSDVSRHLSDTSAQGKEQVCVRAGVARASVLRQNKAGTFVLRFESFSSDARTE